MASTVLNSFLFILSNISPTLVIVTKSVKSFTKKSPALSLISRKTSILACSPASVSASNFFLSLRLSNFVSLIAARKESNDLAVNLIPAGVCNFFPIVTSIYLLAGTLKLTLPSIFFIKSYLSTILLNSLYIFSTFPLSNLARG